MDSRIVKERDLRHPDFREENVEDLEFNDFGEIVRKDRFQRALGNIATSLYGRCVWFPKTLSSDVSDILGRLTNYELIGEDLSLLLSDGVEAPWDDFHDLFPGVDDGAVQKVTIVTQDGSRLCLAELTYSTKRSPSIELVWRGAKIANSDVVAISSPGVDDCVLVALAEKKALMLNSTLSQQEYEALRKVCNSPGGVPAPEGFFRKR